MTKHTDSVDDYESDRCVDEFVRTFTEQINYEKRCNDTCENKEEIEQLVQCFDVGESPRAILHLGKELL
jgi:hypothetical protein